jgi:exodeoxyribonuclease-5
MELNAGQREAIAKCCDWYYSLNYDKVPLMCILGYSGTGKSSIIKILIEILDLKNYEVIYVAYTGKAVNVMRRKGNLAYTVHKTFYNIYRGSSGKFTFKLKNNLPGLLKLIVIDEVSMLNDKFMEDILSFGIPCIALGDPGQLPPIFGENTYIKNKKYIAYTLTEIMRQEKDSAILTLATMARNGDNIKIGNYKNCNVCYMKDIKNLLEYDIIISYTNATRRLFNKSIRNLLKIDNIYPIKNEKLICLRNNYYHEIEYQDIPIFPINGLNCVTLDNSYTDKHNEKYLNIKYKPDFIYENDIYFNTLCERAFFDSYIYDEEKPIVIIEKDEDSENNIVYLDYGYSVTGFKAQGTEWNNVLVIDDCNNYFTNDLYNKWLYTCITRAKNKVDIVLNYI